MNVQSAALVVRRPRNRSGSRRLWAAVSGFYRGVEVLEPRALLSGTLSYSVPDSANHALVLSLIQVNSVASVQITDNSVVVAQQPFSATTSVAVTGAAGHDVLTIDFAGGVPVPSGGVTFTGGGATNSLVLQHGSFTSETYTAGSAAAGALNLDGSAIQFSNVGGVVDTSAAASLVFTATDAQQQINLVNGPVVGGGQTAELNGGATPGFATFDFANKSQVTLVAGAGDDSILLDNSLAPLGLGNLMLDTWSGADTVNVQATPAGTATQINSTSFFADGPDEITVGNAGSVQGILGSLDVADDAYYDDLLIDDSADTVGRTVNFTRSAVSGIAPAPITFNAMDIGTITVNGGTGGNVFTVASTVPSSANNINSGAGADTVNIESVLGGSTLNVSGQGGADHVNVLYNVFDASQGSLAGFSTILGGVNVFNFGGGTTLTLDTTAESSAQTVNIGASSATVATTLSHGPVSSTINFALGSGGVLAVKTGAGADMFNVTPSSTTLQLDGGDPTAAPGDVLNVNLTNVTNPLLTSSSVPGFDHAITFSNAATINFTHMESWTAVPVANADLAISFTGPAQANENGTFTCNFSVTNNGPADAAAVVFTDVLPAGLSFVSASTGSASVVNGTLAINLGTVTNGATVSGTITFAVGEEGSVLVNLASVSSSTADPVSGNNSASVTTSVVDPAVVATGGLTLNLVEGAASGSQTVATFTDPAGPEALADYAATITWGDGSSSTGTITLGNNGVFTVSGNHTYVDDGSYVASVTVNHDAASPVTVSDNVNVADPAVVASGVAALSATQNVAGTFKLATFTDPGGAEAVSSYQAAVSWGDGTTSAGTITFASGVFTVAGGHTYAATGTLPISIVIKHGTAPSTTVSDSVVVSAPVSGLVVTGAGTLSAVEGASSNFTLATFTDPAGAGPASAYHANINWGDGTTSTGTVLAGSKPGSFVVTGNHKFADEGQYTVTISVSRGTAAPSTGKDTVNVSDPNVVATGGMSLEAQRGANATLAVANFTDPGGPEGLSSYSATINWDDGTATAGTISFNSATSTFTVSGTHNYKNSGKFTLTVSIVHQNLPAVVVTDSVKVTGSAPSTPPVLPTPPVATTPSIPTTPSNPSKDPHGNCDNAPGHLISVIQKIVNDVKHNVFSNTKVKKH